jgi:hypothetical protein
MEILAETAAAVAPASTIPFIHNYPVLKYDHEHGIDIEFIRMANSMMTFKICGPAPSFTLVSKRNERVYASCVLEWSWRELVKFVYGSDAMVKDLAFLIIQCHAGSIGAEFKCVIDHDYFDKLVLLADFPEDHMEWWWTVSFFNCQTALPSEYTYPIPLFNAVRLDKYRFVSAFILAASSSCERFRGEVWLRVGQQELKTTMSAREMQEYFKLSQEYGYMRQRCPQLLDNSPDLHIQTMLTEMTEHNADGKKICFDRKSKGANGLDVRWTTLSKITLEPSDYLILFHYLPIRITEAFKLEQNEWPDMFVLRSSAVRANLRLRWQPAVKSETAQEPYFAYWIYIYNAGTEAYSFGGEPDEQVRLYQFVMPPSVTWSESRIRYREAPLNQDYEWNSVSESNGLFTKNDKKRKAKY